MVDELEEGEKANAERDIESDVRYWYGWIRLRGRRDLLGIVQERAVNMC